MSSPSDRKKNSADEKKRPSLDDGGARLVVDEDGRVVFVSDSFAGLVNRPAAIIKDQLLANYLEFSDPDEAIGLRGGQPVVNEGIHRARLSGQAKPAFVLMQFDRITTRDGRNYTIAMEVTGQPSANALPASFTEQILRLLESGAAKAALTAAARPATGKIDVRSEDGELRHFLDMSNDLLAVSSREGVFLRVNGMLNGILGYGDDELRCMSFMDMIYPDDRAGVRSGLVKLMRSETGDGQIIDFETRIVAKDGSVRWTEWRQKRSGSLLYSAGRDVTAIKEQEAALRKQQGQLNEAQAIAHMGHWRWVVGSDDIEWSGEIYRVFGVEQGRFRPTLEAVNAMLHRRDVGRMLQAFQRAIIEHANYEMDCRIVRPNGEVIALFGIMQDVTQRMKHEVELRYAKESAERAYAAKSQFLANMSHELRTPLNAIIGFSEMMQRQLLGPIGTPRYLDYITGIRESGEHLQDLISDILDMSKIEAGKYELDIEEFNVAKTIRLAAHMMEGRAQEASIRLSVGVEKDDQHITADRRAVMQILLNLLSNAVKFTNAGGSVRIECAGTDERITIRVQDTGIGIPASKIACIARPFEQVNSSYTTRGEGGTGLGLAITKDLIEMHGGNLVIESTEGEGTTVTVQMPPDARPYIDKAKKPDA